MSKAPELEDACVIGAHLYVEFVRSNKNLKLPEFLL